MYIRNLSANKTIIIIISSGLVMLAQNDENMGVWQSPFLKFYYHCVTDWNSEDIVVFNVLHQCIKLESENTCNKIISGMCTVCGS